MILAVSVIIKILIAVIFILLAYKFFYKKIGLKAFSAIVLISAAAMIFADILSGYVKPLTESVEIKALGINGDVSLSDEIHLKSLTCGNKEYTDYNISDGKWFWIGEDLCWRDPSDTRQPGGTTQSITVDIPVGWYRTVNFNTSEYCGYAEITAGGKVWKVDTSVTEKANVGRSSSADLIKNQIVYLTAYTVIYLLITGTASSVIIFSIMRRNKFKELLSRYSGKMIYTAIALSSLLLMIYYSGKFSLWSDELSQLTFSGVNDTLKAAVMMDMHTPPLYTAAMYFWYRIAPYGERWLLLPSEAAMAVAVYFTGLCGERIKSKGTGILAALLAAFNAYVIINCGIEFRPQSFMMFFTTILLYVYIRKITSNNVNDLRRIILIGVLMALAGYSHYFGILFSGMIFICDLILFIKKKTGIISLVSYGTAILLYLPWAAVLIGYKGVGTWQPVPTFKSLFQLLFALCGNNYLLSGFFALGIAVMAIMTLISIKKKKFIFDKYFPQLVPLIITVVMITIVFIYARYIGWRSTFWVIRYFFSLMPCVMLICALGVDYLCQNAELKIKGKLFRPEYAAAVILAAYFVSATITVLDTYKTEPYKMSAEWLYSQGDYIYNDSTCVITADANWTSDGWNEYYLTKQGRRDRINAFGYAEITPDEMLKYDRIYIVTNHIRLVEDEQEILDNFYTLVYEQNSLDINIYVRK